MELIRICTTKGMQTLIISTWRTRIARLRSSILCLLLTCSSQWATSSPATSSLGDATAQMSVVNAPKCITNKTPIMVKSDLQLIQLKTIEMVLQERVQATQATTMATATIYILLAARYPTELAQVRWSRGLATHKRSIIKLKSRDLRRHVKTPIPNRNQSPSKKAQINVRLKIRKSPDLKGNPKWLKRKLSTGEKPISLSHSQCSPKSTTMMKPKNKKNPKVELTILSEEKMKTSQKLKHHLRTKRKILLTVGLIFKVKSRLIATSRLTQKFVLRW